MELKEIVNLRKLEEFIDDTLDEERCDICPFRNMCTWIEEFPKCIAVEVVEAGRLDKNENSSN